MKLALGVAFLVLSGNLMAGQSDVMKDAKKFAKECYPEEYQNNVNPDDFLSIEEKGKKFDSHDVKKKISEDIKPGVKDWLKNAQLSNKLTIEQDELFIQRSEEKADNQQGNSTVSEETVYSYEKCKRGGDSYPLVLTRSLRLETHFEPGKKHEVRACTGHKKKRHYIWKSDAKAKEEKEIKKLSSDKTISTFSVEIDGGGAFSKYTVKSTWSHVENATSCDEYTTETRIVSPEKFEISKENWVFDSENNLEKSQSPQCTFLDRLCLDPDATKLFHGKPITRKCWKEQLSFLCLPDHKNECSSLKGRNCEEVSRKCLQQSPFGCTLWEITFRCLSSVKRSTDKFSLDENWGLSEGIAETEFKPNESFADVTTKLAVFEEIQREISEAQALDATQIGIFKGKKLSCEKTIADELIYDCCISMRGLADTLKLSHCSADELALAEMRDQGKCHYVGVKEERLLGVKIKDKHVFCCFPSKLARVFQEESKKQLGMTWGTASHPNCTGVTVDTISQIDFSKIDLSEVYEDILRKTDGIEQKLERFKDRLVEEIDRSIQEKKKIDIID